MANVKTSSNVRNLMYSGKHTLLPPRIPFPGVCSLYVDYVPSYQVGSKPIQKQIGGGNAHHQRTFSESFLIEEQPSWLDDLLNEPESPLNKRGHRRSSSDSSAFIDGANPSNLDYTTPDDYRVKNVMGVTSWGPQDLTYLKVVQKASALPYAEANLLKQMNRTWGSLNALSPGIGLPSVRKNAVTQSSGSSDAVSVSNGFPSSASKKKDTIDPASHESQTSSEKKDDSNAKSSTSEAETKRAKQQFAQRSRVRKLEYIAELERNVQALQAEGSVVSAELEFLNQRNLILSLENKALRQRLQALSQEKIIKHLEQGVLEKEIGRLQTLYQQLQQQQLKPSLSHRHKSSKDLDSQFESLSLKPAGDSSHDPITNPLQI